MKKIIFQSSLAVMFTDFVKLKQLAGYDYISQASLLMHFDRFLNDGGIKRIILSQEIIHEYLSSINHLSSRSYANRFGVLRLFSIWLHQHNSTSYVLSDPICRNKSHSRPAYIFGREQIKAFLEKGSETSTGKELIPGLFQTLFSLLYTTGIRINEALTLNINDFNIKEKCLHIRKGKFRKERYILLSRLMARKLADYLKQYHLLFSPSKSEPVFIGMRHKRLIYNSVQINFKRILQSASIINEKRYKPRIHDLRHTFAVHRLLEWYNSKEDIYSKLPLLSTYMGHVKITSTQVYLHATSELLQKGSDRFHHFYSTNVINNLEELS